MGFRYRKRISVLPGVKVNISKSGISTSIGGKGYTANISKRGVKQTFSIPGTGLSYSKNYKRSPRGVSVSIESGNKDDTDYVNSIASFNLPCDSTSDELIDLKTSVERSRLETSILLDKLDLNKKKIKKYESQSKSIISMMSKGYKEKAIERHKEQVLIAEKTMSLINEAIVKIDFSETRDRLVDDVIKASQAMWSSSGVWDNTDYIETEGIIQHRKVILSDVIEPFNLKTTSLSGPMFSISGNTLYLYPDFIHFSNDSCNDNYISLKDLNVIYYELDSPSCGDEKKYDDLEKSKPVWMFRTKDGSVDLRYKDNKKVPAAYYSYIHITDDKDFDICIRLTNRTLAKNFVLKMKALINSF